MTLDLRPALEAAIRSLRADDPFRPVAVLVPNHLLGVWLSRSIFAETGHMAIEFMLAHELAWRIAAPGLLSDGRATMPENVGLALLLGAIPEAVEKTDTPDYLRAAATTAGFGPAALRTIEDLAAAALRPQALEAAAPATSDPARLRLMARLWTGFQAGATNARLVDRAGLSAERAPRHASRQQALSDRIGQKPPQAPTQTPQTALDRLQQRLFDPPGPPAQDQDPRPLDLDPTVRVLSAAGESLEAVEIARLIQQAADEGVRYEEIGVLLRSPDTYRVPLASAFDRAGIDAFFVEGLVLDLSRQHFTYLQGLAPTALKQSKDVAGWLASESTLGVHQFGNDGEGTFPEVTAKFVEAAFNELSRDELTPGVEQPARLCIVFEEAHSLIPEWNQVAQDADKQQVNRTARKVLQGRKYGLGSLIVTQRTANVTKTILNQCNTIVALQSFDQTGLDFLRNYMGEGYSQAISTLPRLHGILVGRASCSRRPVIFAVSNLAGKWRAKAAPAAPEPGPPEGAA
jgi:hypothetical protein